MDVPGRDLKLTNTQNVQLGNKRPFCLIGKVVGDASHLPAWEVRLTFLLLHFSFLGSVVSRYQDTAELML